jgi:hypothetical protein
MKGSRALIFSVVILVLFMIMISSAPTTKDWTDSFSQESKKPYGSKYIKENLTSIFPDQEIEKIDKTVYEKLMLYNYQPSQNSLEYQQEDVYENPSEQVVEENSDDELILDPSDVPSDQYSPEEGDLNTNEDYSTESNTESNQYSSEEQTEKNESDEYANNPSIQDKKIQVDKSNYLFVNNKLSFDETDSKILLNYVRNGNHVFMAANFFNGNLADTFHLKTQNSYLTDSLVTDDFISKERALIRFNFLNKNFKAPREYTMKGLAYGCSFKSIDSARSEILAYNSKKEPVLIRIKYGDGYFYLSSTPHAYTNYAFAKQPMADYAAGSLSYLPIQKTYWDEYYKIHRVAKRDSMDFISKNVSLRWTWRLVLVMTQCTQPLTLSKVKLEK